MSDTTKRYYWLKLHETFFRRTNIRIVETMPNGAAYVLFYLKLLVESLSNEGRLRLSTTIPYSADMLAAITNTNVDIVRAAIKIFLELEMLELLDDQTLYMRELEGMVGTETAWAEKKRLQRAGQSGDNVPQLSGQSRTESDKSIEYRAKSLELEQEQEQEQEQELRGYIILAEKFRDSLLSIKFDVKIPKNLEKWADIFRLMVERDDRQPARIEQLMRWAHSDPFWRGNILSPDALRKKFDTLDIQSQRPAAATRSPLDAARRVLAELEN